MGRSIIIWPFSHHGVGQFYWPLVDHFNWPLTAYQILQQSIDQVKPVRAHYSFRVGVAFSDDINIACVAQGLSVVYVGST